MAQVSISDKVLEFNLSAMAFWYCKQKKKYIGGLQHTGVNKALQMYPLVVGDTKQDAVYFGSSFYGPHLSAGNESSELGYKTRENVVIQSGKLFVQPAHSCPNL